MRRPSETLPASALERLRASTPDMARQMETAILAEVPRYAAEPDQYRQAILQRCRLATRLFIRIVETGMPPGDRDIRVVQGIARNVAAAGEPLEPLLHALRIGARVGWDETLKVGLAGAARPESLLALAGQVFEYIDQLSSRIAEAYARQVEEIARAEAMNESALFEDLISGRVGGDALDALGLESPRAALALLTSGHGAATTQPAAETTAGRLRTRFPAAVVGQRQGVSIWLLAKEPLAPVLADCAASDDVVFGMSAASDEVPLGRAVEEAVLAGRVAVDLDLHREPAAPRVFDLPRVYAYVAMRSNPEALARSRATLLGGLDDHPSLLETLRAYVETNRSVSATAARVHRHRQSVIYRLRRVSELLEVQLDDAEVMFRLEAAVRAVRLAPSDPGSA